MAANVLKARIVEVRIEEGATGLFYATSEALAGLLVAEPTRDALERAIPKAITALYRACGERVVVTRLEDGGGDVQPWVAFPAEVAQRELAGLEPA